MLESESKFSIIISTCALVISILSYADNKKQLNILIHKERTKDIARQAIQGLRVLNKTLKYLSYPLFCFTNIDQIVVCIVQELREKDKFKLSIKYESLKLNNNVIFLNTLKDSKEFVNTVRSVLFSIWHEGRVNKYFEYKGPNIESFVNFTIQPNIVCTKSLDFSNLFTNLINLENDVANLTRVEFFIEPYDSELFNLLNNDYESILNLLYEALSKQVYDIELTKNMTPEDIRNVLYNTLNYNQIIEKTALMTINLKERVDNLKKELAVRYLTS